MTCVQRTVHLNISKLWMYIYAINILRLSNSFSTHHCCIFTLNIVRSGDLTLLIQVSRQL